MSRTARAENSTNVNRRAKCERGPDQTDPLPATGKTPPLTVLIADDDEDSRALYALYLRDRGWRVVEAENGGQVWPLTDSERPDAIVLDLSMPGVDGWTLTRELRMDRATTRIPVIVVSGHVMPPERERAVKAGCTDFLAKPCLPQELERTLCRVIGRTVGPTP